MKKHGALGVLLCLLLGFPLLLIGTVTTLTTQKASAACGPQGGAALSADVSNVQPIAPYTREAMGRAAIIMHVGKELHVGFKGQLIALMTAMQESTLGDNAATRSPNKDGDAGVFQQRVLPGWYGTLEQVNDPAQAARFFYQGVTIPAAVPGGAGPAGYHLPGLMDITGWQDMAPTVAAQKVQRSAHSDAYAKHETKARQIMSALSGINVTINPGVPGSGACTQAAPGAALGGKALAMVNAAKSLDGVHYSLGSGSYKGPDARGNSGYGIDCSGLTSYAIHQATGRIIRRTAADQWDQFASHRVTSTQLQPGDLLFYAYGRLGGTVDHVGIYLGEGKMIEASTSARQVRITPARTTGPAYVGAARPLTTETP